MSHSRFMARPAACPFCGGEPCHKPEQHWRSRGHVSLHLTGEYVTERLPDVYGRIVAQAEPEEPDPDEMTVRVCGEVLTFGAFHAVCVQPIDGHAHTQSADLMVRHGLALELHPERCPRCSADEQHDGDPRDLG